MQHSHWISASQEWVWHCHLYTVIIVTSRFYRASALQSAILFYQFRPSVRLSLSLSVCLFNAGTVSKWTDTSSLFDIPTGGIILVFWAIRPLQNSKGNPIGGGDMYGVLISSRVCGTLCTLSVWYFSVMAASLPGSWSLQHELLYCTQPKSLPKTWRFDLYQRPSSEEAGTQFFWFLTRREDGASMGSMFYLLAKWQVRL